MPKSVKQHESLFDEANEAWDSGDGKRAFQLFLNAAEAGEKYAFNSVGYFYDNGIGVKRDSANAYAWYRRAALRGDIAAYANLAAWFRDAGNLRRTIFWLEKAYAKGDGSAACELGKIHLSKSSPAGSKQARQYLTAASESKYIDEAERKAALKLLAKLKKST